MKRRSLHWSLYFLAVAGGIIAMGAALGAIVFPAVGLIFDTGKTAKELVVTGSRTLGFFFMVWAPGIALVLTVKRAYEQRRQRDAATR